MPTPKSTSLLRQLRRVARVPAATTPDAELLGRFVQHRDEEAFADLVSRHGPMVLNLCRRLLGDPQDAEDAWQGAFLILARRAGSLRSAESLAAFLHGVAYRVALKVRSDARRHRGEPLSEAPADVRTDPLASASARELLAIAQEELARLPEAYRLPVLLCCFDGHSQEEAARRLGWSPGSLQGRLERGRKRLRERLARRGLALASAQAAAEASRGPGSCAALAGPVVSAAALVAASQPVPPTVVSAKVLALAEGVLQAMFFSRVKTVVTVLLLAAALLAGGTALVPRQTVAAPQAAATRRAAAGPAARQAEKPKVVVTWKEKLEIKPHGPMGDQIFCAVFSPDGKRLFCGLTHGGKFLDAATGKEQAALDYNHPRCAAFSPDGKTLATGHFDALLLWDGETGKLTATLDGKTMNIGSVAFTKDGKFLASAEVQTVRLWDVAGKKEVRRFDVADPTKRVAYAAAFSPDGKRLTTAEGPARTVKLWEVATGKELMTLGKHKEYAVAVAFSPDGQLLASSDGAGVVRLWDAASGKELASLNGPINGCGSLAFSPDGKFLASVGSEHHGCALRIWDVRTRKEVATLKNHTKQVWSVAFSRDGRKVVTAGDDAVRVWEAEGQPARK